MYKALYRQYRPVVFDDVFGQEVIIKILKNSIMNSSFGHAYMFFGPRGTGKTSISKIFARSVNCLNPQNGNSCGECDNCKCSYEKDCVDIIEIDAASNNGVDEIRELRNKISLVPAELKYKIYIIDEVHMLSIGAFNALLKTLEEPPAHVIFILATTDPQKVPETIISRCQCFSFKRISTEEIIKNLKKISTEEGILVDDDVISEIAYSSNGGMRDALSSLDQLRSYSNEKITLDDYAKVNSTLTDSALNDLYNDIFSQNYSNVLSKLNLYNEQGKNIISILEKLMRMLRLKIVNYFVNGDALEFDKNLIHRFVLVLNEKLVDIRKSSNPLIYIEMIILDFMNSISMDSNQINIGNHTPLNAKTSENPLNISMVKPTETVEIKENSLRDLPEKNIGENAVNIEKSNPILENNEKKSDFDNPQDNSRKILNLNDILDVRINNAFATANKDLLKNELSNLDLFNDYTFDPINGYLACSLLDAKFRVVSEQAIIISFEYDSIVNQNLDVLNELNDFYNSVTNSNRKIAIVSDAKWEELKNKYILDLKNGITYSVKEEPEEVFIATENNDIIGNNAIELFGDIVEVN